MHNKNTQIYCIERVSSEEVMDKLDMFQAISGKIDEFIWWDLENISSDAGTQFTSTDFQDKCQTRGVWLTLAAPEHQEMNRQVEVTRKTLRTIAHSNKVHAWVLEAYIHFAIMYTSYHILPVLPIKDLINNDGNTTTRWKLATGTKHSILHLSVLFCSCVVRKDIAHYWTKALNMSHQAQNVLFGIFVGIPHHQKGYLVYVPHKWKIVS